MFKSIEATVNVDDLPRKKSASDLVPGLRLRKAIEEGLEVIGPSAIEGIFEDLERRGVKLDSDAACSIEQVNAILKELFGEDAAKLMMDKIYRSLDP